MDIFASIFEGLIAGIEAGTGVMVEYGLALLGLAVTIYVFWRWLPRLATAGSGHLGEVLGEFILILIVAALYLYILTHWLELTDGILEALLLWGGAPAGDLGRTLIRSPASLWEMGQRAVAPIAAFDTWQRGMASTFHLATNPLMFVAWLVLLGSFFWLTVNFGMALVEWALAVLGGALFLPLSYLRPVGHLGEMAVGWLSATGIRIFALIILAAIMVPLIEASIPEVGAPAPAGGVLSNVVSGILTTGMPNLGPGAAPKIGQTLTMVGTALLFAILAWLVPGRASRLAGGATLALGGSDIIAGAMGAGRMAMLIGRSAYSPVRGASWLVSSMRG
jgi:type IV secretion system protein TrbL